ncbi:MAG: YciI family protein [Opitutaceae bacterium]|nr:YciI family protein [Opitutaceae bacterium]
MATNPLSTPAAYLLLFRNTGPENYQHLSPPQRQEVITRWNAWFDGLVAQGKAVEGQPLEMETRIISGPGGARITDGPFPEAKEAVGGYVTLMVSGLEEATEIAKRHPGLAHGLIIEIRELTPHCHLGVNTRSSLERPAAAS